LKVEVNVGSGHFDSGGVGEESFQKGGGGLHRIWEFKQNAFAVMFS